MLDKKRRVMLRNQFKDLALILSELLLTGYSVENAMEKALTQLNEMERGRSSLAGSLQAMCRQLQIGVAPELLWEQFGKESGVREIEEFSRAFSLAKRSGASIPRILNSVTGQLTLKIQTENQIDTLLAGKRLEQKIMLLMPAAVLSFVSLTSPDLLAVMYETWMGRVLMTGFLGIYIGAFFLALRMGRSRQGGDSL